MKKSIFAMMMGAAMLVACGGAGTGSSTVDDAIAKAEEAVKLETSPMLGQLPSINAQKQAAEKELNAYYKEEFGKAEDLKDVSKTGDERKADMEKLQNYYDEKIKEEVKKLDGKTIKVDFDKALYSAASAKIVATGAEKALESYKVILELTTATEVNYIGVVMKDASNNDAKELGYFYHDIAKNGERQSKAGEKLTVEISQIAFGGNKAGEYDHLFIKGMDD